VSGLGPDEFLGERHGRPAEPSPNTSSRCENPAKRQPVRHRSGQTQEDILQTGRPDDVGSPGVPRATPLGRDPACWSAVPNEEVAQYNLDSLAEAFPDLVRFALERYSLPRSRSCFASLLEEEISIRDLRAFSRACFPSTGRRTST